MNLKTWKFMFKVRMAYSKLVWEIEIARLKLLFGTRGKRSPDRLTSKFDARLDDKVIMIDDDLDSILRRLREQEYDTMRILIDYPIIRV